MLSDAQGSEHYQHSDMEFYDYPGKYKEKSDGERYAKIQLQSEQAMDHRRHGQGLRDQSFPGRSHETEKNIHSRRKMSNI